MGGRHGVRRHHGGIHRHLGGRRRRDVGDDHHQTMGGRHGVRRHHGGTHRRQGGHRHDGIHRRQGGHRMPVGLADRRDGSRRTYGRHGVRLSLGARRGDCRVVRLRRHRLRLRCCQRQVQLRDVGRRPFGLPWPFGQQSTEPLIRRGLRAAGAFRFRLRSMSAMHRRPDHPK